MLSTHRFAHLAVSSFKINIVRDWKLTRLLPEPNFTQSNTSIFSCPRAKYNNLAQSDFFLALKLKLKFIHARGKLSQSGHVYINIIINIQLGTS